MEDSERNASDLAFNYVELQDSFLYKLYILPPNFIP